MHTELDAIALAKHIVQQYATADPIEIAQKAGVCIREAAWFPATYAEYDRKLRCITVNKNAPLPVADLVAHELGHFFIHQLGYELNRLEEEAAAALFATTLQSLQKHSS